MSNVDITLSPVHQVIAGRFALAWVDGDQERLSRVLAEAASLDSTDSLAVLAVQTRNLVTVLTELLGSDDLVRNQLESTILQAQMFENPTEFEEANDGGE